MKSPPPPLPVSPPFRCPPAPIFTHPHPSPPFTPPAIHQAPRERNFHAFYLLLAGADPKLRGRLGLRQSSEHGYTRTTPEGCGNEASEFAEFDAGVCACGGALGGREALYEVLAAILHLGDVTFEGKSGPSGHGEQAVPDVAGQKALGAAAAALQYTPEDLLLQLTERWIAAGPSEEICITLAPAEARQVRDAVAKAIYQRLFVFYVAQLNTQLSPAALSTSGAAGGRPELTRTASLQRTMSQCGLAEKVVGLLDIFGFESLSVNGLEQARPWARGAGTGTGCSLGAAAVEPPQPPQPPQQPQQPQQPLPHSYFSGPSRSLPSSLRRDATLWPPHSALAGPGQAAFYSRCVACPWQICINLANERLHSLFLSYVFHGLPPSQLKILLKGDPGRIDNTQCVELLCKTPVGVLHLLDFQCKAPRATEASFCLAVNQTHGASQFLRTPKLSKAQGVTADENTGFFVRPTPPRNPDPVPSPEPWLHTRTPLSPPTRTLARCATSRATSCTRRATSSSSTTTRFTRRAGSPTPWAARSSSTSSRRASCSPPRARRRASSASARSSSPTCRSSSPRSSRRTSRTCAA